MKKYLICVLSITLSICCSIITSATDVHQDIITINDVDVIFDNSSTLTDYEKLHIAECVVYGHPSTQTYGLICNLFGHKTTTEYVTTITHRVNTSVPRCLEEHWEVVACSRCDYVESTRLSFGYKNCCPVD